MCDEFGSGDGGGDVSSDVGSDISADSGADISGDFAGDDGVDLCGDTDTGDCGGDISSDVGSDLSADSGVDNSGDLAGDEGVDLCADGGVNSDGIDDSPDNSDDLSGDEGIDLCADGDDLSTNVDVGDSTDESIGDNSGVDDSDIVEEITDEPAENAGDAAAFEGAGDLPEEPTDTGDSDESEQTTEYSPEDEAAEVPAEDAGEETTDVPIDDAGEENADMPTDDSGEGPVGEAPEGADEQSSRNKEDDYSDFGDLHDSEAIENNDVESANEGTESDQATDLPPNSLYDSLPEDRREIVENAFADSPEDIKNLVDNHGDSVNVVDKPYNPDPESLDNVCTYRPEDNTIGMRHGMGDDEYANTFPHEFGHHVDNQLGRPSRSSEFNDAIAADRGLYDRDTSDGSERYNNMLNDCFTTGAAYNPGVSDNLSALFNNCPDIQQRFRDEGVPYYGHFPDSSGRNYWDSPGRVGAEIFANNFSIRANNDPFDTHFLNTHFPNTTNASTNIFVRGGNKS